MLYIHLFGHLHLFDQERPYTAHVPRRAQPLWAYLLLNRDKPIQRDHLAYLLSPNSSDGAARTRLRSNLHGLQQALPPAAHDQPWLLHDSNSIQWNPGASYWLDVAEFERLSESADHLPKSVSLYAGDLLVNVYDDWLVVERQRLRNQYLDNLRKLSAASMAHHNHQQAILYLQQILAHEPLNEDVIGELLRLWYWNGNRARAIDAYQRFERLLKKELGVTPAADTQALYQAIYQNAPIDNYPSNLHQELEVQRPTNLPSSLNSFFGRSQELLHLQQLLTSSSPAQRLITITGLAGCGKTRQALEIANRLQTAPKAPFPDGIFFVELAAIQQPESVLAIIARTLNISEEDDASLPTSLAEFLRHRHLLLVLDNFEQVVAAGPAVADLLAACPNVRMLVTSRTALRIYGEYEYVLAPLPLPDAGQAISPQQLKDNPAVALFLARAEEHCALIELNEANAPILAEICTLLDGLPLAIELAANRAHLFPPEVILAHLTDRLAFLSSRERNLPERHRSLRNAIAWSYDLLSTSEKTLFAALGVFADHWTPQAAQAVCDSLNEDEMLASLDNLAAQSLIYIHSRDEPLRFSMASILREFSIECLQEQGIWETSRQRHASYYSQLAGQVFDLKYAAPEAWMRYFLAEPANIQAALAWSLEAPEDLPRIKIGVHFSTSLARFWIFTSQVRTGLAWYERQLPYANRLPPDIQSALLAMAGCFTIFLGNHSQAKNLLEEAIIQARQNHQPNWESITLRTLGTLAEMQEDYQRAKKLLLESIAVEQKASGMGMNYNIAVTYNNLAITLKYLKKYDQAKAILLDVIAFHQEQNDERGIGMVLSNVGNIALEQNQNAEAEAFFHQSLMINSKFNDLCGVQVDLAGITELATRRNQNVRAIRLHGFRQMLHQTMSHSLERGVSTAKSQRADQHLSEILHARVGEQDFAAAWAEGQAMTLEQAVAYALETPTQTDTLTVQGSENPDFPSEPLDDEMATQWLETHWHPQGLKCPVCGTLHARPFRTTGKSGLAVYRCLQCQASYNLYSNTPLQGSHLRPSQAVILMHQLNLGESSSDLARRLGISRQAVNKLRKALKMVY